MIHYEKILRIEDTTISFWKFPKGSFINDVRRFLTIIDPPTPPNVQFLPNKRPIFWVILDPPTPPKIGHH